MNSKIKKCLRRMAEGHLLNQLWENDDPPFGQCFIWYNEKSITLVFGQNKCRELLELDFIQVDHQDNAGNKFYKITDKGIEFINPKKMNNEQLATELSNKPDLHILGLLKEIGQTDRPMIDNYATKIAVYFAKSDEGCPIELRSHLKRVKAIEVIITTEAARRWRLLIESGEIIEYGNQ